MQATADTVPAKQHYAKEACFKEERCKHFVSQQWAGYAAGKLRKAGPVGAKLIGHHQSGNHAHTEVDGENFRPEMVEVTIYLVFDFSHSPSSTARKLARPMVIAGKRMWKATVKPNCILAR